MVGTFKQNPALYTAGGAALSYYGLASLRESGWSPGLTLLFLSALTLISLFRVLSHGREIFSVCPRTRRSFRKAGFCLTAFFAGLSLGWGACRAHSGDMHPGLPGENIIGFSGVLEDDPRAFGGGQGMGRLFLRKAAGRDGVRVSASGKIPVFFPPDAMPRLKDFGRGAEVYVEGSLISSEERGPSFRAGAVHILKAAPAVEQFRTALRMKLLGVFPGPVSEKKNSWTGLAGALLFGVRDNLDDEISEAFRAAGVSHVLALSGMHLAILSSVIAFFLRKPLGLKIASVAGGIFIIFYVFLIGAQPSLVRSAIMYLLGALAVLGTFKKDPLSLLGLAFLIQIVTFGGADSPSFILSYLALGGILLVGEPIRELLRGKLPEILAGGLSASLGAFITTAGAVSLFFGVLRPAGIIAGLIIVPLVTVFMFFALAALAGGMIFPPLLSPLGFILSALYNLLDRVVSFAALAPGFLVPYPLPVSVFSLGMAAALICLGNRLLTLRKRLAPFN